MNRAFTHSGKFCRLLNSTNLNSGRAIEKEDIFEDFTIDFSEYLEELEELEPDNE